MSIPSGGLVTRLDFSDTSCYSGSGSTVYDLVGNNDFDILNSPTFVSDGEKSYFQFTASTNKLQTITPVDVTSQTVFTFSVWAYNTGGSSAVQVAFGSGQNDASGGVPHVVLNVAGANIVSSTYGYGVGTAVGTAINQNQWYLLTMTCDGTTNKIYINGTLAGSASRGTGSIFNDPTNFVIGQYSDSDTSVPWIGRIGAYYYYNTAISATDVENLFYSTADRFGYQLANYDFIDPACYPGSGTTISDSLGGFSLTADANTASTYLPLNGTFTLTGGSSSYIRSTTGNYVNTGTSDFSFEVSFSLNSFSGNPPYTFVMLNGSRQGGYTGYGLNVIGSNLGIHVCGIADIDTGYTLSLGTWYNVAFTVDGSGNYIVYVNGASVYTGSGFSPNAFSGSSQLAIGYPANAFTDETFVGRIGSVKFYDTVLPAGVVLSNYNAEKTRYPVSVFDFQNIRTYSGSGNTVYDIAGNTNLVKVGGTWVSGTPNYWDLNSTTELANTNPGAGFASTIFTVNCWYYYDTPMSAYSSVWGIGLDGLGTMPVLSVPQVGNSNIQWSFGQGLIDAGVVSGWNLFTFWSDGTNTKLYLNGALVNTVNYVGTVASPYTIRLGCASNASNAAYQPAEGRLGYWNYYREPLSSGQILDFYNSTSPYYDNLIHSYDFSDPTCYPGTGNTVYDLSESNLDLPITGATFGGTGQSKYFSFDGVNDYIGKTGVTGIGNTFTISFWAQQNASNPQVPFSCGIYNPAGRGVQFTFSASVSYDLSASFNYGLGLVNSLSTHSPNTWDLYTYTADGTTCKLYINGALQGSDTQDGAFWDTGSFAIGANTDSGGNITTGGDSLSGKIATLEVYNTALTSGEVSTIYTNESSRFGPGPTPYQGIVGGRQFNQGFNG